MRKVSDRKENQQVAVDRGQAADEGGEIIDRCAVDRLADLKQALVLDKLVATELHAEHEKHKNHANQ